MKTVWTDLAPALDRVVGCGAIGLVRATLRLAAYSVSSLTLCWGHLLPLFRTDRRALHDILAGTRVVRGPVERTGTSGSASASDS